MRRPCFELTMLFVCYGYLGWLLSGYQASLAVWLVTEIVVVYLAWSGVGAIPLSLIGSMGIATAGVMTVGLPDPLDWQPLSLNPAQIWALTLGLSWVWAIFAIFELAFVAQRLRLVGWKSLQVFAVTVVLANLGLRLGQMVEIRLLCA